MRQMLQMCSSAHVPDFMSSETGTERENAAPVHMSSEPPPPGPPGGSGLPPGKGDVAESSASGASGSTRQAVVDLFGADLAPAAVILVMLLLNLMKGEPHGLLRNIIGSMSFAEADWLPLHCHEWQ